MSAEGHCVNGLYRIVSSNQFHLNSLAAKVGNNDDARIELQFEEVDLRSGRPVVFCTTSFWMLGASCRYMLYRYSVCHAFAFAAY